MNRGNMRHGRHHIGLYLVGGALALLALGLTRHPKTVLLVTLLLAFLVAFGPAIAFR